MSSKTNVVDSKTKSLVLTGIMVAFLCAICPFSIPLVGMVPISLATFGVFLVGYLLGWKYGTISVAVYVFLGAIGLPVFSGFGSGLAKLTGPTGGYIVAFILMAFILGVSHKLFGEKRVVSLVAMLLGTVVNYTLGTLWFMHVTGMGLKASLMLCVVPFIVGDLLKVCAVLAVAPVIKKRIGNLV